MQSDVHHAHQHDIRLARLLGRLQPHAGHSALHRLADPVLSVRRLRMRQLRNFQTGNSHSFIFIELKLIELQFQGKCASCGTSSCAPMGISADKYPTRSRTNVRMYLDTTSSSPYCKSFPNGYSAIDLSSDDSF